MKIQLLMRAALLLSLFISILSPSISDDRVITARHELIIKELSSDINHLLTTSDDKYIDDYVFGDCIHSYLGTKDDAKPIPKEKVIPHFPLLFDTDFNIVLRNLTTSKNLYLHLDNEDSFNPLGDSLKHKNIAKNVAIITINKDEVDGLQFSKQYWFYQKDKHWVFAGMTCVG